MAISYVGGAKAGSTTSGATVSVTYAPTNGNSVLVCFATGNPITGITCVDSASNPLNAGPLVASGALNVNTYSFYYVVPSAGITGFTCNWTNNVQTSITVVEYAGVGAINPSLAGNTASGNSNTASITVTTTYNNDWISGSLIGYGTAITHTVGVLRENETAGGTGNILTLDNTVATAGSISLTGTLTSNKWAALVYELQLPQTTLVGGYGVAMGTDYQWGGGDPN